MDPILLDNSALTMRAGTPVFLAPEVIWEYRHLPATSSTSLPPMNGQFSSLSAATDPSSDSESNPALLGSRVPSSIGKPPITKAIDVWALGITFFCLLTGRLPYNASRNEWALYNKIANENIRLSDTLGADKVPTGVRRTIDGEKGKQEEGEGEEEEEEKGLSKHEGKKKAMDIGEGPVIFALLERFLQRDPANRIKLEEVKVSAYSV
jgi:serine/threonine protein kinase